ncbi:hypothetical protein C8E97_2674 [Saccharothrix australiensis]|uniref:Uncharacterized protein n=1 Tax=Saccharothrix australiensis TaxID=2072 RepID=A0A495VY03_9PSEU|nr:hypothetical protein C8E97_2674 [Saccharothrix australiensis]
MTVPRGAGSGTGSLLPWRRLGHRTLAATRPRCAISASHARDRAVPAIGRTARDGRHACTRGTTPADSPHRSPDIGPCERPLVSTRVCSDHFRHATAWRRALGGRRSTHVPAGPTPARRSGGVDDAAGSGAGRIFRPRPEFQARQAFRGRSARCSGVSGHRRVFRFERESQAGQAFRDRRGGLDRRESRGRKGFRARRGRRECGVRWGRPGCRVRWRHRGSRAGCRSRRRRHRRELRAHRGSRFRRALRAHRGPRAREGLRAPAKPLPRRVFRAGRTARVRAIRSRRAGRARSAARRGGRGAGHR